MTATHRVSIAACLHTIARAVLVTAATALDTTALGT
jgi:hypothetical protein